MAYSHCIIRLGRLCVRPRLMRFRVTVTASVHYTEEYQNNMVSQISGKISRMRKWLKPGILSTIRECQV